MSNGDDVLDNWEEIDEAGLDSKLDKLKKDRQEPSKTNLDQHQQEQEQNLSESAMSFQNSISMMMVLQQTENEYKSSNYTNATPTVKILRRPAQQNASSNRDNGIRPKQPIKTLQQREQEYAEARLRILGSAKNPEDDMESVATAANTNVVPKVNPKSPADSSNVNCSQTSQTQGISIIQMPGTRQAPMTNNTVSPTGFALGVANGGNVTNNLYSPTSSMMVGGTNMRYSENVLRMPRGPDGTSGFQMRR